MVDIGGNDQNYYKSVFQGQGLNKRIDENETDNTDEQSLPNKKGDEYIQETNIEKQQGSKSEQCMAIDQQTAEVFDQSEVESAPPVERPEIKIDFNPDYIYIQELMSAPKELRNDPKFVITAILLNPEQAAYIGEALAKNSDFILNQLMKIDPFLVKHADQSLLNNPDFLKKAVMKDWSLLQPSRKGSLFGSSIEITIRNECFNSIQRSIPDYIEECKHVQKRLKDDYGIQHPFRMKNQECAELIMSERDVLNKISEDEKVAVVIYAQADETNALENNNFDKMMDQGYKVYYFECETEKQYFDAIETVGEFHKIDVLVSGGHGNFDILALGKGDPLKAEASRDNEIYSLDKTDIVEAKDRDLAQYMADDSFVLLESCSTGGKDGHLGEVVDVASGFKSVFPDSEVWAPKIPTSIKGYRFDDNGNVVGIDYSVGDENTKVLE